MRDFFKERQIEFYACIPLERCKVYKKYLLDRAGLTEKSTVIMMLLPYRSEIKPENISVYASVRDYHGYTEILRKEATEYIKNRFEDATVELFSDHSPIDEVHAACISGLGFIGDNGLLINEKYSSFVFLCEIITSLTPSELGLEYAKDVEVKRCYGCGACHRACPSNCMAESDPRPKSECLSAITQKKGMFTDKEISQMIENKTIWGCDACQNACPYTKGAEYTPIEYFKVGVITELDLDTFNKMNDAELGERPFMWRGKDVILRNIEIYEKHKSDFKK
jgi:epoxyqueuosine reductase QueG